MGVCVAWLTSAGKTGAVSSHADVDTGVKAVKADKGGGRETRRRALLRELPGFDQLPPHMITQIASGLEATAHESGAVLIAEGEIGDRMFVIAEGEAEVTIATASGQVPVAFLKQGEWFGEIALLSEDRVRQATVTAISPIKLFALSRAGFNGVLAREPALKAVWERAAEGMRRANFLKRATPFANLPPTPARALAEQLVSRVVAAGTVIVREGEAGDECYLVRRGGVAVILDAGTPGEREVAHLRPGDLFGEMAILSEGPRSATVQATEESELWVLRRASLLEAMAADRIFGLRIAELFRFRDRPRRAPRVQSFEQRTADGQRVTVLKNPALHTYCRLSEEGLFLWDLLDGRHSLRDLVLGYFQEFKRLTPAVVVGHLDSMAAAGMLETRALSVETAARLVHSSPWARRALLAGRVLDWQLSLSDCDKWLSRLYEGGARIVTTGSVVVLLAALAAAGFAAFLVGLADGRVSLTGGSPNGSLIWLLILANLAATCLHEAGHAFAAKSYGCEVDRIGVGWYWFSPIAFVDTSDMWTMGRGPRIVVDLAGVFANSVCAGIAALAALLIGEGPSAGALWQFVLMSYAIVLLNLNPLLEYDGYFVLIDWLDRPSLRREALGWLAQVLTSAARRRHALRGHGVELSFALASLAYIVAATLLVLGAYRALLETWVSHWLPAPAAAAAAWLPAAVLLGLGFAHLAGEVRVAKFQS